VVWVLACQLEENNMRMTEPLSALDQTMQDMTDKIICRAVNYFAKNSIAVSRDKWIHECVAIEQQQLLDLTSTSTTLNSIVKFI